MGTGAKDGSSGRIIPRRRVIGIWRSIRHGAVGVCRGQSGRFAAGRGSLAGFVALLVSVLALSQIVSQFGKQGVTLQSVFYRACFECGCADHAKVFISMFAAQAGLSLANFVSQLLQIEIALCKHVV
jgi:hypothetical protein